MKRIASCVAVLFALAVPVVGQDKDIVVAITAQRDGDQVWSVRSACPASAAKIRSHRSGQPRHHRANHDAEPHDGEHRPHGQGIDSPRSPCARPHDQEERQADAQGRVARNRFVADPNTFWWKETDGGRKEIVYSTLGGSEQRSVLRYMNAKFDDSSKDAAPTGPTRSFTTSSIRRANRFVTNGGFAD